MTGPTLPRSWRTIAGSVAIAGIVGYVAVGRHLHISVQAQPTSLSSDAEQHRALLKRYCITCHNQKRKTAGLSFDAMDLEHVAHGADVWEKVIRRLRMGDMPPQNMPRPDRPTALAMVSWLETELDRAAAAAPNPGTPPALHRLNRNEYANAVRDLLAVDVDSRSLLPADNSDHGFDTVASVLSVSPLLLERYLSLAHRISRLAVGDPTISPAMESKTYDVAGTLFQDDRMSEDLPFGSRGGLAVRHRFPLEGEYVVKVRLQKNYVDYVRGLDEPHQLELRVDGVRLAGFTIGGGEHGTRAPISFAGNISGSRDWEEYALSADAHLEHRFRSTAGTHLVGVSLRQAAGRA
jgi:cytochrome c551/c552